MSDATSFFKRGYIIAATIGTLIMLSGVIGLLNEGSINDEEIQLLTQQLDSCNSRKPLSVSDTITVIRDTCILTLPSELKTGKYTEVGLKLNITGNRFTITVKGMSTSQENATQLFNELNKFLDERGYRKK